jgi:VIT1/CCC1 family predicted Fe2+/Mn2+ transporter
VATSDSLDSLPPLIRRPHHRIPPPPAEAHHRDIAGGAARAAVFGINDGLVSNVALILAMAGAGSSGTVVRLAGLAGLIAGAVSMASGEYVSMTAQRELLQRELEVERRELRRRPQMEETELAQIYMSRGVEPEMARELAGHMMRDPDIALETHAREELGIDPTALGSPLGAAVSSFVAFALGALLPLLPWLVAAGTSALGASIAIGALAALGVGAGLARFTGRSHTFAALRQLGFVAIAAGVTYGIGSLFDVAVT